MPVVSRGCRVNKALRCSGKYQLCDSGRGA